MYGGSGRSYHTVIHSDRKCLSECDFHQTCLHRPPLAYVASMHLAHVSENKNLLKNLIHESGARFTQGMKA